MKKVLIPIFLVIYFLFILFATDPGRWDSGYFEGGERYLFTTLLCLVAGLLVTVTGWVDNKLMGIAIFLVVLHALILAATDPASWVSNHRNLGQRIGLEGILCLGAGLLIITGGIDLSIGSVVSLCACVFCMLVLDAENPIPIPHAVILTLLLGGLIGFLNGFLVTFFNVQAFVVTLCGLFLYRGAARWVTNDKIPEIAEAVAPLSAFCRGSIFFVPVYLWLLLGLFVIASVFLHLTIFGRYFFAIGSNEKASRYSGIRVSYYKILAYVLCSIFAAVYAIIHVIHYNTVQPSTTGNFLELYAIAGAVLGGCSLRGGEGTTLGMLIGTAIMRLLPNLNNMLEIPSTLEPTVIGGALLVCAILDEMLRRSIGWRDIVSGARMMLTGWWGANRESWKIRLVAAVCILAGGTGLLHALFNGLPRSEGIGQIIEIAEIVVAAAILGIGLFLFQLREPSRNA